MPFVQADSHSADALIATGCSFGAYHAANFCLKRADLFPLAICMSGVYDVSVQGGGERGEAVYFNNPMDYVANTDTATTSTGCARARRCSSSAARASGRTRPARSSRPGVSQALLGEKGIRHELDLWGHDVPHDWPSWQRQIAHHVPRFT